MLTVNFRKQIRMNDLEQSATHHTTKRAVGVLVSSNLS